MSEKIGVERNSAATVYILRSAKYWLNDGECCGQKDSDGVCAAPACTLGTALRWFHKAADEIETLLSERDALRVENDLLREALKPFTQFRVNEQGCADTANVFYSPHDPDVWLRVGHFRAARAALSTTKEPK